MQKKLAIILPFLCFILMAATGNIRWSQLRSGDRHGNGAYGQASDGTGTSGNCVKFDAAGNLTDAGTTCGGGGSTLYFGNNAATVSGAINTVTLGSTPVAGSPLLFVDGKQAAYTASGGTLTLATWVGAPAVVTGSWATTNSTPGTISLSGSGSAASGALYTEAMTGNGAQTATFNYSSAGSGYYQAIVVVKGI